MHFSSVNEVFTACEKESRSSQQQPEGKEVDFHTTCLESKPVRCGGANSPTLGSNFKDGHLLHIPQQRRDADKVPGSVEVRSENLQAQPSLEPAPGKTSSQGESCLHTD